jgi:phosphate transport system permease protein
MTDLPAPAPKSTSSFWNSESYAAHNRARRRSELWLRGLGLGAIGLALLMLAIMLTSILTSAAGAFRQTHVTISVPIPAEEVDPADPFGANWRGIMQDYIKSLYPEADTAQVRDLGDILSNGAQFMVRDAVVADPSLIGQTLTIRVPVSDPYDQLAKGYVNRDAPEDQRRLNDAQIEAFDAFEATGAVSQPINIGILTYADSRFPELAGLRGAMVGTIYLLLTTFLIAFPVGIGAAIYLEEFAPKNRLSDFIEVNINNLAAVPSVVFGLLALSVFINGFGLPRGAPFVGGLTIALMSLPTIIIATRAALKAVPPSIREAALGIGASKQQVVFQHVLPLAMPGIMTGTILAMANAIGETAPLLLIGMNAFLTSVPTSPFESATTLPTQIFIWADSPERGFVARTSAGIVILLTVLIMMNAVAIYLRQKFERKW